MRPEKQFLLNELKEKIEHSHGMIFVNYDKFPPLSSWDFASELAQANGFFEAVKKRVFIKALKESGLDLDIKGVEGGHLGIVFLKGDAIETAKKLFTFKDSNENLGIHVISAYLEKKAYPASDVEIFAKLPDQQQVRASFLGLLDSPMIQMVSTLENLLCGVLYCLESKSQQEIKK